MKKLLTLLLASCISQFSFAQFKEYSNNDFAKKMERSMRKVNDSIYACAYECSLNDYRVFLADLKSKGIDILVFLPDTSSSLAGFNLNWKESRSSEFLPYRLKHPAYANFPITNITPEAALAFCGWMNEIYANYERAKFPKAQFILPNELEWKEAAYAIDSKKRQKQFDAAEVDKRRDNDFPWLNDHLYVEDNSKSKWVDLNVLNDGFNAYLTDGVDFRKGNFFEEFHHKMETVEVNSYEPNHFGLYCMCGNVAEMTSDSTLLKGGSFAIDAMECRIGGNGHHYSQPAWDVGFRLFIKIKEPS
jgi:formylglycine-generating enzyme required for sulfatase activity